MTIRKTLSVFLMILVMDVAATAADELRLKNGDRITGQIVAMEKNKLIFKTGYAGEIHVDWGEVANLTSNAPITVRMGDDTSLRGTAEPARGGKMIMKQDKISESATFDLSEVTEINPKSEPAVKIKARANVGLSFADGNTNTGSTYLDGKFAARTAQSRFTVYGEYNREEAEGVTTADHSLGSAKYDHFITGKWYGYGKIGLEKDDFKDLNLRTDVGAGPGYQVYESERLNLGLEAGLSYVNEDYIDQDDDSFAAYRWAVDYDQYLYKNIFQVFLSNEGLVSVVDTQDIFIRTRTGIRIPFYKHLNVTGQYNLDWDNKPSPGTEKTDQQFVFTLGYSYE